MYDWNLRLSKRLDIWTIILCWATSIFDSIACFIVYSTASAHDLYLPDQSPLEKAIRAFIYVGVVSLVVTIVMLGDRFLAKKNARQQNLPSDFTPPVLNFKKRNIVRIILIAVILFFSLPWALALIGIFISDIPVLNLLFLGEQLYHDLPSVHLGSHHGTWAFQYGVIAVILSISLDSPYYIKLPLSRSIIAGGITFLAGYAIINGLEDFLNEQVMKRGINLVLYDVIKEIYESILFYPILAVINFVVIILWFRFASKKKGPL